MKLLRSVVKMSLQQFRRELRQLKNSITERQGLKFKIFIFRANGFTDAGETEEDFKNFVSANPHTHVLKLVRKSFRKG